MIAYADVMSVLRHRRQIQMQSAARVPARQVVRGVLATEGVAGFYRGFLPNALKNMPNKGDRRASRITAVECDVHPGHPPWQCGALLPCKLPSFQVPSFLQATDKGQGPALDHQCATRISAQE